MLHASGFTIARPHMRVLVERAKYEAGQVRRAAREKKHTIASGAASVRGKVAVKVLGARDKAAEARRTRKERRAHSAAQPAHFTLDEA